MRPVGSYTDEARDHEGKLMAAKKRSRTNEHGKRRKPKARVSQNQSAPDLKLLGDQLERDMISIRGAIAQLELLRARGELALEHARKFVAEQSDSSLADCLEATAVHSRLLSEGARISEAARPALERLHRQYEGHILSQIVDEIAPLFDDEDLRAARCGAIADTIALSTGRVVTEARCLQAIAEHVVDRREMVSPKKAAREVVASLMNVDASTIRRADKWRAERFFREAYRPDYEGGALRPAVSSTERVSKPSLGDVALKYPRAAQVTEPTTMIQAADTRGTSEK